MPENNGEIPIPALLRASRSAYGDAIRARLAAAGFDDVPRNGPYVLGGMASSGAGTAQLTSELGVSRQAASQLIDTLVLRGYLNRQTNPDDRRRMTVGLTDRGEAAADAIGAAIGAVDAELAQLVTADELAGMRAGLQALTEIRERHQALHQH